MEGELPILANWTSSTRNQGRRVVVAGSGANSVEAVEFAVVGRGCHEVRTILRLFYIEGTPCVKRSSLDQVNGRSR